MAGARRTTRSRGASRSVLRLLDANANRALEGLRVCEEIARLQLESPREFRRLRRIRHGLAEAVRALPVEPAELLKARDSRADIGRRARASAVDSVGRLLVINFQRTKEALRTLEECARLIAPSRAAAFQRLRFHTYELERTLLLATLRHP